MTPIELRQIRKTLRLTQDELATKLDVKTNTVARWERGERPISQTTELAMNYLVESPLHVNDGYRADVGENLRVFVHMEPDGKAISIYDRLKKKMVLRRQRPAFSFEAGLEPNLAVFQRFAIEQAHSLLGRRKPTDEDVLNIDWIRLRKGGADGR